MFDRGDGCCYAWLIGAMVASSFQVFEYCRLGCGGKEIVMLPGLAHNGIPSSGWLPLFLLRMVDRGYDCCAVFS